MQKIDNKIKELEINITSKDNYCIIDERSCNTTSDDSDNENSNNNNEKNKSIAI